MNIEILWNDVRQAARSLAKRPGFTVTAALTLALGIGASTAVFSIVEAVLLRPLPFRDPEKLVAIWITSTREAELAKLFPTYRDFTQVRDHATSFTNIGAATWAKATGRVMTGRGPARELLTIPASANFFDTLGVPASLGRTFNAGDEKEACAIVLANSFWTAALASDLSAVGSTLTLDEQPCRVVGVMPQRFAFYPRQSEAWVLMRPGDRGQEQMQTGIFARLKPDRTLEQARGELRALYRGLHTEPEARFLVPIVNGLHSEFTFLAGRTLSRTLLLVFSAVLAVLLISCLNVANLFLARLRERRREMALRTAIGSERTRLIGQTMIESLLLSALGTSIGLVLAYGAVAYFRFASPIEITAGSDVRLNLPVFGFSILLSVMTAVLSGLVPAIGGSRVDPSTALKSGAQSITSARHSGARVLVSVQVALSFVLAIGAGLLLSSALRIGSEDLGFRPDRVVATRISLPRFRYQQESDRLRAQGQLLERMTALPGVELAALTSKAPPRSGGNQTLEIQGRPSDPTTARHIVGGDAVTPDFFRLVGIPLRRGRAFDSRDHEKSLPVAVINEALVREYFHDEDPLGQQIRIPGGPMPWLTVVGVAGNLKHSELMNEMSWVETPVIYRSLAQEPRPGFELLLRFAPGRRVLASEVRDALASVDPAIPFVELESLSERVALILTNPRFRATLFAWFAAIALILSAVGLYGVLSQAVLRRTPEFGVRRAVGAPLPHLVRLVAWEGGVPVLVGLVVGFWTTQLFQRVIANLLFGVQPANASVVASVATVLLAAAALAMAVPAWRASRVSPMAALRHE